MFSKNLKYYRLRKQMSKKELAEKVNVTPMAITNYENGDRKPNMETMKALAKALDVRVTDFLAVRNGQIVFSHGEFRKSNSLSAEQQEYVREFVEEHFSRFMTAVEILGGDVLPAAPQCHALSLSDDAEENAAALRAHLGFAESGPIEDLTGKLENKGILVCECKVNNKFSGMNGFVDGRPFIVLNPEMNPERNRSTIIHELAHLMFSWPEDMEEKAIEKMATAIGGAFLFPKTDAIRELGIRRSAVTGDMILVAREYGISMLLLVKRAEICRILPSTAARTFYVAAARAGWQTGEPSRIPAEKPALFEQLVYRAVNEGEISVQRGAELLGVSFDSIAPMLAAVQ
ncbi:MAG: ImmA/IrrE family metallo-endopeptidase [Clostridia bacterium]|nr:ImmA/IrrE family metallo-endopeptidase [Clostridia bacterium]